MANRGGHAAHLTVFALGELKREPGIGNAFAKPDRRIARRQGWWRVERSNAAAARGVVADPDAAFEFCQSDGIGDALDLRPVFAAMAALRIEEIGVEARLVAQEQQTLGVGIETPERVNVFRKREFGERAPARSDFGSELRKDAVGFVKGEEHEGEARAGLRIEALAT